MSLESAVLIAAISGDELSPKLSRSHTFKHWLTIEDFKRCMECAEHHGKIYSIGESVDPQPPLHPNCRCYIEPMTSIKAGTATFKGIDGADWTLKYDKKLPNYYITAKEAMAKNWKPGKWPSNFVPNKHIAAGIYKNRNCHLPQDSGRIWYEADINYTYGKRNKQRIVWSNDGLIFVTYDHYETFYEIV